MDTYIDTMLKSQGFVCKKSSDYYTKTYRTVDGEVLVSVFVDEEEVLPFTIEIDMLEVDTIDLPCSGYWLLETESILSVGAVLSIIQNNNWIRLSNYPHIGVLL